MALLRVRDFSCIHHADLELAPFTVLIGPQGSGKSVLAKLVYYCFGAVTKWVEYPHEDRSLDEYTSQLASEFASIFPPAAWGAQAFEIQFTVGQYGVTISRRAEATNAHFEFTSGLELGYERLRLVIEETLGIETGNSATDALSKKYEILREISASFEDHAKQSGGQSFVTDFMFVPAGRTLFSYIGRSLRATTRHTAVPLDPITERFGELLDILRTHYARYPETYTTPREEDRMRTLFGGKLVFETDASRLETEDGRSLPLALLSSGAQELLPLFMAIMAGFARDLMFIEEPEAHLFPSTQSKLIEILAELVDAPVKPRLFVTTHSPYTLAKLNNLIKAGELASRGDEMAEHVADVVPKRSWLPPHSVRAYAIANRELVSIMDDSGLIDATYIDEISNEISNQFLDLLAVEYPDAD